MGVCFLREWILAVRESLAWTALELYPSGYLEVWGLEWNLGTETSRTASQENQGNLGQ